MTCAPWSSPVTGNTPGWGCCARVTSDPTGVNTLASLTPAAPTTKTLVTTSSRWRGGSESSKTPARPQGRSNLTCAGRQLMTLKWSSHRLPSPSHRQRIHLGQEQDLNLVLHPQGKPFESHHEWKQHREPIHNHRHLLSRAMLRGWLGSTAGGHFKASAPTSSVCFGNNEEGEQL